MISRPLVSVLVLTYNNTNLLKSCLDSCLKSDYSNLEFIVSDNGSSDNISGFIKGNYLRQKIKVVRLKENRGLTGGFNFGFKFCRGKYIMILSNDTKLAKNAISHMVKLCEGDSSIGIVSPKIIQMENPKILHHAGSFMTYSGLLYHYGVIQNKNKKKYQKNYYIFSCNGAGFLIRKKAIQISGLYEADFFIYYDESDLSHRIWLSGYTVVYCFKATIWHLWGATIKRQRGDLWYYNHRNHLSSLIRNLSVPYLIPILLNFNLILILWFIMNLIKLRFDLCWALPKAYFWHLRNINRTLRKRKFIQGKMRRVTDYEMFNKCLLSPDWKYYFIHLQLKFNYKDLFLKYSEIQLPERVLYRKS